MRNFMNTADQSSEAAGVDPSIHELFNEATEWLQYSRGVTATLSDLVHEADVVDCKQMSMSLDAIAAMTQTALRLVNEAHVRWHVAQSP
jgi:hypothetical protein